LMGVKKKNSGTEWGSLSKGGRGGDLKNKKGELVYQPGTKGSTRKEKTTKFGSFLEVQSNTKRETKEQGLQEIKRGGNRATGSDGGGKVPSSGKKKKMEKGCWTPPKNK